MTELTIQLATEEHTEALGQSLAAIVSAPITIYLEADLGVGKTRLSRAILHGLGHTGTVKSPTYTIVEPYELDNMTVYHFDLYRLTDPSELDYMGIRDYFTESTVALIEWPNNGHGYINEPDLVIKLAYDGAGRTCQIAAKTPNGTAGLDQLKLNL